MTYTRKVGPSPAMEDYMEGKITPQQYVDRIRESGNKLQIKLSQKANSNKESK